MEYSEISNNKQKALESLELLRKKIKDIPKDNIVLIGSTQTTERIKDCERILERLIKSRGVINKTEIILKSKGDKSYYSKDKIPNDIKKLNNKITELDGYMKLDFESLYIFGDILIDQWALMALSISGINDFKKEYSRPFSQIVEFFDRDKIDSSKKVYLLRPLWYNLKSQMLWIYYNLKKYRNKFIIHSYRALQRSTFRAVIGEDFMLFRPSPPGKLNDEEIKNEIKKLVYLDPFYDKKDSKYWKDIAPKNLLDRLFKNIGKIENKNDRDKVASLFIKAGGATPTFQIIAKSLFGFIDLGTKKLIEIIESNINMRSPK